MRLNIWRRTIMEVRSFSYATCSDFWTPEEDEKLTTAIANTHKKEWRKELKTDWAAVSALVPSRTRNQCIMRWERALNPSVARTAGRAVPWTEDEDNKLKDLVQMHGGKDWAAITALVPDRTQHQCSRRWHTFLKLSAKRATEYLDLWTADEDNKLKDLVQMHGTKHWAAIAALVPGRTTIQCARRWHRFLKIKTERATSRYRWTEEEDSKLKDLVQIHGGKDWAATAALLPGRTVIQCTSRWHRHLNPSIVSCK
jgi:myb proto-oncogene protein